MTGMVGRFGRIFLRYGCKTLLLLLAVSVIAFILVSLSPVDPVQQYVLGAGGVSAEQRAQLEEYWGVNDPPVERYITWLKALVRGDFGQSLLYRRPVLEIIGERFVNSLALMLCAWLFSGLIGFGLGCAMGMTRDRLPDRILKKLCYILSSVPTFWLGLVFLLVFSVGLGWFPLGFSSPIGVLNREVTLWQRLHHLVLPALTLSLMSFANIALHTRQKLVDVLESEYVLFARARGERAGTILRRHGLRNIALPALTLQFASFAELFGGSVLAETVFSYPGLGSAVAAQLRRAAAVGHHPLFHPVCLRGQSDCQPAVWRGGSSDPGGDPMSLRCNRRTRLVLFTGLMLLVLLAAFLAGRLIPDSAVAADFTRVKEPPSWSHPFGTDHLGRDLLLRTLKGLSTSLTIGIVASLISAIAAVLIGIAAATGSRAVDGFITWLIDLVMGVPHTVLVILISFACGRGLKGLLIGVAATHWTSLARLIRGEVLQLRSQQYVAVSRRLGKSSGWILLHHLLPHLIPQFLVGLILMLPHAILHEASISFLGYGLPPEQPAIGIILAESMKYLSAGMWWPAVFPGLLLVATVLLIDRLGETLRAILDPHSAQE